MTLAFPCPVTAQGWLSFLQEVQADCLPCHLALPELQVQHSWAAGGASGREGGFRYLHCTVIFSEHVEKQNSVMPNTARERFYATVQLFPLLGQRPREKKISPLNDRMPIVFDYNKGIVTLGELLLGKPSNMQYKSFFHF